MSKINASPLPPRSMKVNESRKEGLPPKNLVIQTDIQSEVNGTQGKPPILKKPLTAKN